MIGLPWGLGIAYLRESGKHPITNGNENDFKYPIFTYRRINSDYFISKLFTGPPNGAELNFLHRLKKYLKSSLEMRNPSPRVKIVFKRWRKHIDYT